MFTMLKLHAIYVPSPVILILDVSGMDKAFVDACFTSIILYCAEHL